MNGRDTVTLKVGGAASAFSVRATGEDKYYVPGV